MENQSRTQYAYAGKYAKNYGAQGLYEHANEANAEFANAANFANFDDVHPLSFSEKIEEHGYFWMIGIPILAILTFTAYTIISGVDFSVDVATTGTETVTAGTSTLATGSADTAVEIVSEIIQLFLMVFMMILSGRSFTENMIFFGLVVIGQVMDIALSAVGIIPILGAITGYPESIGEVISELGGISFMAKLLFGIIMARIF